jgi:hypothetical protein
LTSGRIPIATGLLTLGDTFLGSTVSENVLTFTGTLTALRTVTFQDATGTVPLLEVGSTYTGANTFQNSSGVTTRQTATQDGVALVGRAGGTSSFTATITPTTLTASRTLTVPDASGTIALTSQLSNTIGWNRALQEFSSPFTQIGGYTWTSRTLPSSSDWFSVCYGNGIFVAIATGSTAAATSPDGVTWTARTLPSSSTWASVCYGNGVFVAIASTTIAATSPDGITWTARTLPTSTGWRSVCFGNGTFVAISQTSGTIAATSTDGITWTQRTLPATASWWSVVYGNGVFVAIAFSSSSAAISSDGITWTLTTLPSSSGWYSVCYGNGLFVAVSSTSGTIAATSPNGTNWTTRTLSATANWVSVCYGNGLFVAVAGSGVTTASSSPDGITWTARTLSSAQAWNSNCYGNGVFVTVAQGGSNTASTSGGALALSGDFTAPRTHTVQDATGTIPLIEVQPCASFQNKLINPRFDIWQRGTSFAAIATNSYHADRWTQNFDGTGVATISRQAHTLGAIPTEPEYFLRYQVTSAGAGGTFRNLIQAIESVRTLAGKRVQVTFWAKADAARNVLPQFAQVFGTGGTPSGAVFANGTTCALTTSWQQFTQTITLPSISGKTVGTNRDDYLGLLLNLPLNTTCTIDFSEVEVKEVAPSGQVNTPMEIRPPQVELALCKRYYRRINSTDGLFQPFGYGLAATTAIVDVLIPPDVEMRASPTLSFSALADFNVSDSSTITAVTSISLSGTQAGRQLQQVQMNTGGGLTQFRSMRLEAANRLTAWLAFSAEL